MMLIAGILMMIAAVVILGAGVDADTAPPVQPAQCPAGHAMHVGACVVRPGG